MKVDELRKTGDRRINHLIVTLRNASRFLVPKPELGNENGQLALAAFRKVTIKAIIAVDRSFVKRQSLLRVA